MADTDYPASWYAATRDFSPDRPPLAGRIEADVAIVGGGFAGLHTARLLAMRGRGVVLVERRRIGWGASGRNGGFVSAGFAQRSAALIEKLGPDHARKLYAQSQRGVAIVRTAIDELGRPDIFMGTGKLTVSRTDQGAGFADRTRALAERLAASFEPWETARVRVLIATPRYHQAIHDPQSFHIHPLNFALALAGDIERRGGTVHERTDAVGLERQGAGWRLRTPGGEIAARHVVLAGNADLGRVQPRIARALLPVATYVAVTAKLGPRLAEIIRWPGAISDTRRAGDYYRIVDGDRLLWGGRITTDTREPSRLREMMRRDILAVYPDLDGIAIDYAWPGVMGYAPHMMPQIGEIEPGLWVCSAFGGHGVAQTAAGADVLAAAIAGEDDRYKLFRPFGTGWAGGPLGRLATQLVYWKLQASDWWDETRQAKNAETLQDMTKSTIGDSPRRREDARFITGSGAYLDDLRFEGLAHAVVVRSPHAHAWIRAVNTDAARRAPGVLAVLTAADASRDGLGPLRPYAEANVQTGEPFIFAPQPLIAGNKVRFGGEAVALVVAETHGQALDAAELVAVDYEALPAVTSSEAARAAGAPVLSDEVPGNVCIDWRTGDAAGVEAAFAKAKHVVTLKLDNHRIVTNPMEPRGCIGQFDPAGGRYTLHVSSQNIHINRDHVARALGVERKDVRFIAPDVGGGFGAKNFAYAEHALVLWAARRTGRPVKWIASRSEVFLADHAARDMQAESALALDETGRFLALKVDSIANLGAYMAGAGGGVQTYQYVHLQGTVYRIPAIALHVVAVVSNTAPIGVTRGPGFAETVNILERLIDAAAQQHGFDRIELRRINMVPSDTMPMTNSFGFQVDSGTFPETFDHALARADLDGFAGRRRQSEAEGRLRGLGFAYHIKGTGGPPEENVDIRFEPDGTVSLITGTQHIGQGHETTFPQILAHRLGVPNERIRLRQGDTDLIVAGGGHGSSRATYMGGTAMWRASDEIIAKGTALAADALEAAEADIRFEEGRFVVSGTDRAIGLLEIAALGREKNRPLDTYHAWTREHLTFPNGAHVVEVEIDRDTGRVWLARYTAVDDYGVLVNPMIASGQAHGAMAQGVGQALLEHAIYDAQSGQMVTASFMDYALPRADDLVSFDLGFNGSPCTTNPLGVKGCGEAGAIAAFPAIANAILDALAPLGVKDFEGPATPAHVWQAMQAAR